MISGRTTVLNCRGSWSISSRTSRSSVASASSRSIYAQPAKPIGPPRTRSHALEPLLPDAQCLDLRVQGRPRNAELCRRPGRPGHAPPARSQCRLDHLSFPGGEVVRERLNRVRRLREFPTQPALVDGERLCLANDDGALDDVL